MSVLPTTYITLSAKAERVLAEATEPLTARQIAEAIGSTRDAVRLVLSGMRREGRARSVSTEDGNLWTAAVTALRRPQRTA